MFKKQKEKLKANLDAKKYELKQAAKEKITDAMPDPVKSVMDYKGQKDMGKATKFIAFDVAGIYYHSDEIKSLGTVNNKFQSDAAGTQYEYKFHNPYPVTLEFEPTNEVDPFAIKVLVNDIFIGYVPRVENIEIGKFVRSGKPKYCHAFIKGGDHSYHKYGRMYVEEDDIQCQVRVYYK